jgi:hypothetical protein
MAEKRSDDYKNFVPGDRLIIKLQWRRTLVLLQVH